MGIFSRISTLFKAEVNAAIDKREDPEKVLNQTIRDMQEQLNSAKTQVAESIAYEKRLKIQYDKAVERAKEWEGKAMQAVNAGRDDLAVEALSRKEEAEKEAAQFRVQWEAQKKGCDQIKEKLKAMNNKIEEAKRKKSLLVAQAKRAEASKTIHKTLAGMDEGAAFSTFDRMAEKVETLEAEAQASEDLAMDFSTGDTLDKQISELKPAVNSDALAALKAKMGKAPAQTGSYDTQYNNAGGATTMQNATSWDDL